MNTNEQPIPMGEHIKSKEIRVANLVNGENNSIIGILIAVTVSDLELPVFHYCYTESKYQLFMKALRETAEKVDRSIHEPKVDGWTEYPSEINQ